MFKTQNGWTKEAMITEVLVQFQGQSINSEGDCLYRGPKGTKCAVGMFIPDKVYKPEMDNLNYLGDSTAAKDVIPAFRLNKYMPLEVEGMSKLQSCHDSSSNDESCLNRMLDFIEYNVTD